MLVFYGVVFFVFNVNTPKADVDNKMADEKYQE